MMGPIQQFFPRDEFDYQKLKDVLKDYARPRDKITDLIRKGMIIRVKKGLYILGDGYRRRPYSKELLANLIYGPSYISLDYALQYHGLIPERVEAISSVTIGRSRRYRTPVGIFIYRTIRLPAFRFGMTRVESEDGSAFLIATAEKALCDKIRQDRGVGLRSLKNMRHYLFRDLRIDEMSLAGLNPVSIAAIACHYRSAQVRLLAKLVEGLKQGFD